ncbi:hypothetical protein SDC9_204027 [bioreactor metagenome]|uniref:Uncharacterized protein n=1 Tax=bioreactor metagenome TaxID=1076179 RepID=A0A645J0U9_9ZZZZ
MLIYADFCVHHTNLYVIYNAIDTILIANITKYFQETTITCKYFYEIVIRYNFIVKQVSNRLDY